MNDKENPAACSERVVTILVNWRQPQRTLEAVNAIERQTQPCLIVVVDNGSNDGSAGYLTKHLPSSVRLVTRDLNGGFGTGVNQGLREVYAIGGKYVWLVNNDAVPEPDCLEKLVLLAQSNPKIGVVGARIVDPFGSVPDHAGSVMDGVVFNCRYSMSSEELNNARFAWVTGACMLLNVNALREIGEFDPELFMYWEDADLCCRLKKAGYSICVSPNAVVIHQAGTSSNEAKLLRYKWHIHSQCRWVEKNYRPKSWGIFVIYLRNFIKSMLDRDWNRFVLTVRCLRGRILRSN